ncbi:hypothetical protein Vadar_032493 [Vaccinium darrowii]|uniref:Uncharacterized protein n=1 Tax=Vaccinium darrowii TaxID=229202 RepID=A0ACB7ZMS8_9ERIC|nr:hypothetical protein Vadar_032493 [Vaccinium darrowii]
MLFLNAVLMIFLSTIFFLVSCLLLIFIFGEKSAFGGVASRSNQSSSFGSGFQQTQTICGTNPFGSSSSFCVSTQNASGWSSAPSFTFGTGGPFDAAKPVGASSTSVLGVSSTSSVGARRSPAFDTQFNSATGSSTSPSFSGTWGSSGARSTSATFATTGVGQFSFRGQQRRSRLALYTATDVAADDNSKQRKLQSISCMHINKDKNHEELRWDDYQSGDKGGIGICGSPIQSTSNAPSSTLFQSPVNPQTSFTPNAAIPASTFNSFNTSPSFSSWMTTSSSAPNQFVAPIPTFPFTSTSVPGFNSGLSSASTQPSPMFQSVVPLPQTSSLPSFVPPISQPNMFSSSSLPPTSNLTGPSQTIPFLNTPLEPTQTAQTGPSANSEFPRSSAGLSGFEGTTGVLDQSNFSLPYASSLSFHDLNSALAKSCTQNTVVAQPVPSVSPFEVLPSTPQLSIHHLGSTLPIRYGISSMPVLDKPAAAVRASSLLTSRNLSHRRIRLPARKYDHKNDDPKVPFFSNDEGMPTASKGGAVFFRRENPRNLVFLPAEQWPQRSNTEKMSQLVHASLHVYKNGTISAEVSVPALVDGSLCQYDNDHLVENTKSNHENMEQATDVEASMPRLSHSDYYTKPQIHELVANERAEPGFCCHVKNFLVGRHGYGSIMFVGETDVRRLDLGSHVKFNNREVMVYMNEGEKPPVGEGLNKAAEVTLLNLKCIDKIGNRYIDGPKVDKYRDANQEGERARR